MANILPPPTGDPIAQELDDPANRNRQRPPQTVYVSTPWERYFIAQGQSINQTAGRSGAVSLTAQGGSIGASSLASGTTSGLYSAVWYARITTPATNSSSLTVTIGFTDHGVPLTVSGAAITGNTTATAQSGDVSLFWADAAAPITYATTYASSGATQMAYQLYVILKAELV